MSPDATPADVAAWMLSEYQKETVLYQDTAAGEIAARFGNSFVYENANGNLALSAPVLTAFRKISGDDVVWSKSERYWRAREKGDVPGRNQP